MEEEILIWEQPPLEKPEFRLYYDDKGKVICYSCEKIEGTYIIIDAATYAAGRPDVRVIDGKISTAIPSLVVSKLMPNNDEGVKCAEEEISIVVGSDYKEKTIKWKLNTYEL
jgi:hypothetical protein